MTKRQTAQQRYQQQTARRAQPTKTYEVVILCPELGTSETVTVASVDEWLARPAAMFWSSLALNGEHVDYIVNEIR